MSEPVQPLPGPPSFEDPPHVFCVADSFRDGPEIRPVRAPNALVWAYFNVIGEPPGSLEARRFAPCPCGCGRLTADPSASKDAGPSWKAGLK